MELLRVVVVKIIIIITKKEQNMQNLTKKRFNRKGKKYVCRRGCDHSHQHIATAASGRQACHQYY